MKKISVLMLALVMVMVVVGTALAGDYPEKPIKMIVAFSAGGGTDTAARTLAKYVEKYLGQQLVVVNKPGGSGEIGFTDLALTKTDGYTIGFINTPHVVTPPIMRETRFNLDSFKPICNIVTDPGVLVVKGDSEFKTLADLVEYGQNNTITAASGAPGGDDFLAGKAIMKETGITFNMVPFNGSSEQKAQVLGGFLQVGLMNASQVKSLVDAGDMRVLAVMASKRSSYYPDTPTFKELGYSVISGSSRGVAAPAGMSTEQIQVLEEAFAKVVKNPDFLADAEKLHLILDYMNSADFTKYLDDMDQGYRAMWEEDPWN